MQQQSNNLEEVFQATQVIALQLHNRLDRLGHGHEIVTEAIDSMWVTRLWFLFRTVSPVRRCLIFWSYCKMPLLHSYSYLLCRICTSGR